MLNCALPDNLEFPIYGHSDFSFVSKSVTWLVPQHGQLGERFAVDSSIILLTRRESVHQKAQNTSQQYWYTHYHSRLSVLIQIYHHQ